MRICIWHDHDRIADAYLGRVAGTCACTAARARARARMAHAHVQTAAANTHAPHSARRPRVRAAPLAY